MDGIWIIEAHETTGPGDETTIKQRTTNLCAHLFGMYCQTL